MSGKPVIPREQARRDVAEGIDYYLIEAGEKTALAFVDALKRFPWLVFYVEHDDHVDVWRVLRAERDIPAWMREGADRLNP